VIYLPVIPLERGTRIIGGGLAGLADLLKQ